MRRYFRSAAASIVGLVAIALPMARGQGTASKPKQPAPAAESIPLSTYIPADGLYSYLECDGFNASHADAWHASAAYRILNETATGPMFEDLFSQIIDRARTAQQSLPQLPAGAGAVQVPAMYKLASNDALEVVKHSLNEGFVHARLFDAESRSELDIEVYRKVSGKGVYEAFVRWMGKSGSSTAKFGVLSKRGRKIVIVDDTKTNPSSSRWAWWFEKNNDLVRVNAEVTIDRVLDLLEAKKPNAGSIARVAELAAAEGSFQPVLRAFYDYESLKKVASLSPSDSMTKAWAEKNGITGLDLRWGLDGRALMMVARLDSPSPRRSPLTLIDQPTFNTRTLPLVPASATSFRAVSLNLPKVYETALATLNELRPGQSGKIEEFARKIQEKTKLRLKEDILAKFGPKMTVYQMPTKPGGIIKLGIQVPKIGLMIETPDIDAAAKAVDQLVYFANREFKAMSPPPAEAATEKGANRRGAPAAKKKAAVTAEFTMTSPTPRTYILKLPPALAALTNASVTITIGKRHIAIASDPATANELHKAEAQGDGRWKADSELVDSLESLPKGLIYLSVGDPKDSLPQALASLPMTVQSISGMGAAAATMIPQPALPVAPAGGAPANGATPAGMQRYGQGIMFLPLGGMIGSGGGQNPDASAPGASPPTNPPPVANVPPPPAFRIDPARLPTPESVKPLLFPGLLAVSVDARGLKITSRDAFPDLSVLASLANPQILGMLGVIPPGMLPQGGGDPGRLAGSGAPAEQPGRSFMPKPGMSSTGGASPPAAGASARPR